MNYFIILAYLQHDDYNVIVVDWSEIAVGEYILASRQVKDVGRFVAAMIDFLETKGMDPTKTTLVGHSLGAHVMGLAGYFANNTVNYVVGEQLKLFTKLGLIRHSKILFICIQKGIKI